MMPDDITQAVLSREDVARYLRGGEGISPLEARERIHAYLDELRTTQRYQFYRALKHPLYPILRKIERTAEGIHHARAAVDAGRVIYVSNHKSHLDYLIEPLVLEDHGVRPPIIAAGINLFGGAFGFINRHVTGAIPIRRNARDPAYLATLKAYVAEVLRQHDVFFYPEGGRSYSGELKPPKTGLLHAALMAENRAAIRAVPVSVAYDLVLEDRVLARLRVKGRQRPFTSELAEMVGTAVGYESRAWVVVGEPIPLADYDPESRRAVMDLARRVIDVIGRQYKVLPTALVANAMRPSILEADLESRVAERVATLAATGANLAERDPVAATLQGVAQLEARGIIARDRGRVRVRERSVLRYYGRSINHLLGDRANATNAH
jgi:glycerol-3-phosphate O-acyltransferase